jgi:hypothetical protein
MNEGRRLLVALMDEWVHPNCYTSLPHEGLGTACACVLLHLQVDVALQGWDPHAVGVAKRTTAALSSLSKAASGDEPEDVVRRTRRDAGRKAAAGDKGFSSR